VEYLNFRGFHKAVVRNLISKGASYLLARAPAIALLHKGLRQATA
jgi:hypothetical protein